MGMEPFYILGDNVFNQVDIRIRVRGGGSTSQVYAIRQAIAKAIVAYYQKYVDEASKKEIKEKLIQFDRTLLVDENLRSSEVMVLVPVSRSLTVNCIVVLHVIL